MYGAIIAEPGQVCGYRDQHRRASGCTANQASGSRVAGAGGETYDNWSSTSRNWPISVVLRLLKENSSRDFCLTVGYGSIRKPLDPGPVNR